MPSIFKALGEGPVHHVFKINFFRDMWYSSPLYASGLAINDVIHSAMLYSGLNIQQFLRFCQFVGVTHTSPTTYYRFQRLYAAPTVHQEYKSMETRVVEECCNKEGIVVSGDCRMDSPGFSAVKGTYTLMDHDTGLLLSMEHGDKRQVGTIVAQKCLQSIKIEHIFVHL